MTDEMMTLRTLLEKSSDADLLREMIGFTAQRLMELDVEGKIVADLSLDKEMLQDVIRRKL